MVTTSNVAAGSANPSQSDKARQVLSKDYENFLKLLTVQLSNQDPTQPLDTNQVTAQIAQLSQVEQSVNMNKNLEQLVTLFTTTQYNSVAGYLGKQIDAEGNSGVLHNGKAPFVYYLNGEAATTAVTIKDTTGRTVYTGLGPIAQGRNQFVWNGKNSAGQDMPEGIYTIELEAKDAGNNVIANQTYTTGVVDAIDSADGQVYLSIGGNKGLSIPISKAIRIATSTII